MRGDFDEDEDPDFEPDPMHDDDDTMPQRVIAEARGRIHGLVNRGAEVCKQFVPQSERPVSCKRCGYTSEIHLIRDLLAVVESREEPPTPPVEREKEQVTRMDSTSVPQQHIDAGHNEPASATVSDHQKRNHVSCHCPAKQGEDCPLTAEECDARTDDYAGLPWVGARLRRLYEGFWLESLNGVVCSIPETGLNTSPHRTWCVNCQRRWMELKALADMFDRPQPISAPPEVI
jgi:hypothetical protein